MRYLLNLVGVVFFVQILNAQTNMKSQAEKLLSKMTVEEKIGQMTQITMAVFAKGSWSNTDGAIDTTALKKAILNYHVGSMLNTTAKALPVDKWREVITQIQDEVKHTRLKIPVLYGLDAIHGQTYTSESTLFPQNIAIAATRNTSIAKLAAKVTAKELRASGVRWNFAPVLDIGRQPLWSRFPETYGEDVHIVTSMGVSAIKGYEEDGLNKPTAVASCMKHFIGYSNARNGKDRTPIYMPEIEMREYYLPQFREAVKAGSASVMINSSEVNGVPVHASKYLLNDILRNELGFEGLIVSDWEDIIRLHTRHNVAATPRAAVVMAVNAGIDMSMVPADFSFYDLLLEAVKKGEVKIERINDAVKRILILKYKLGLFDDPYPEADNRVNFGVKQYQEDALNAAREAMTLLKNQDNMLPLSKNKKVLVTGPGAQSLATLNGCWSYTWQGKEDEWYPADSRTIYQAIAEKIGPDNVVTNTVKGFESKENYDIESLKQSAQQVDIIILCLGENAYAESPGNIGDLALPHEQVALAKAAAEIGKPVILILTEGRPRFITSVEPDMKGILMAYWSGKKTGEAIADVLFGDYNPDGRLPFTYHKSMGEIVLYDRKPTEEVREIFNDNVNTGYSPLYPFGHGLSYTTFEYSDMKLSTQTLQGNNTLKISVTVKNSGTRDGKHSVELYSRDMYASITPSMRRLRAYQKIFLKAGQSKEVTFLINKNDLAFVNEKLETVTGPGEFIIFIGDLEKRFTYMK